MFLYLFFIRNWPNIVYNLIIIKLWIKSHWKNVFSSSDYKVSASIWDTSEVLSRWHPATTKSFHLTSAATLIYTTLLYYSLYCTVLYSTLLYYTLHYCTIFYTSVLYSTVQYFTALYCMPVLFPTLLYSITILYTVVSATTTTWLNRLPADSVKLFIRSSVARSFISTVLYFNKLNYLVIFFKNIWSGPLL